MTLGCFGITITALGQLMVVILRSVLLNMTQLISTTISLSTARIFSLFAMQTILFTYVNIGTPGRAHDAFIFSNSQLHSFLQEQSELLSSLGKHIMNNLIPLHLIGDSAFPFQAHIMKPYPHRTMMLDEQREFNFRLSRARRVIENAFGRLKGRWRILRKRLEVNIDRVDELIEACVILHNICERKKCPLPPSWTEDEVNSGGLLRPFRAAPGSSRATTMRAKTIRDTLSLHYMRNRLGVQ